MPDPRTLFAVIVVALPFGAYAVERLNRWSAERRWRKLDDLRRRARCGCSPRT